MMMLHTNNTIFNINIFNYNKNNNIYKTNNNIFNYNKNNNTMSPSYSVDLIKIIIQ
jgi:hypothetical protein